MFESLQDGLSSALRALSGRGRLTESNMRDGLQLVQRALLEADVSLSVVKGFMGRVSEQAVGETVLKSLNPTNQLIYIVYQELVNLMGPVDHSLHLRGDVSVLMLCGLQGSGKTTTCGKLGRSIKQRGRKPMLVAADLQRPAAIQQLQVLGQQLELPVFADLAAKDPVALCLAAVKHAKETGADVAILDTAGRLHVDAELMHQLSMIDRRVSPDQVYLVVDAMTGQDAVHSAKAFNEALELDGVIMTKLDGDARGGAALSVKAITGVPIKFVGTGEHLDALEEFHPDRMAGRILGQGDVLTLVEQAHEKFDQDEMAKQEARLRKGEFTLDDFKKMLGQTKKLGPINKIMSMLPGMSALSDMLGDVDAEGDMRRLGGIVDSMTPDERRNPSKVIDQSRRRRIAAGAGVEPHEVNELVKQFDGMADVMKRMSSMGIRERMRTMQEITQGGMLNPGGKLAKQKVGTGKRLTSQERAQLKKLRDRELRRKKREQRKSPEEFGEKVVLVVEDEAKLRKVAVKMLERLGLRSMQAETAKDALDLLAGTHADVLFTDIELRGGMNGTELAAAAQELDPNIRVLFTTGYAREAVLHDRWLQENVPWLLKPYSHRELARELKALFVPYGALKRQAPRESSACRWSLGDL